jgi:hypothetical protein
MYKEVTPLKTDIEKMYSEVNQLMNRRFKISNITMTIMSAYFHLSFHNK